jgi:hypothetical protein
MSEQKNKQTIKRTNDQRTNDKSKQAMSEQVNELTS